MQYPSPFRLHRLLWPRYARGPKVNSRRSEWCLSHFRAFCQCSCFSKNNPKETENKDHWTSCLWQERFPLLQQWGLLPLWNGVQQCGVTVCSATSWCVDHAMRFVTVAVAQDRERLARLRQEKRDYAREFSQNSTWVRQQTEMGVWTSGYMMFYTSCISHICIYIYIYTYTHTYLGYI